MRQSAGVESFLILVGVASLPAGDNGEIRDLFVFGVSSLEEAQAR